MDAVQNMEGEFEPLHIFIHCYHETFLPTFLLSQTVFQTIQDTITELAAVSTSLKCLFLQVAIMEVAELMAEILDPTPSSYEGSSMAAALTFAPNPLPQSPPNSSVLNGTQAVGARTGNSERADSSGPFAPPQRHPLLTQHDHTSTRRRFLPKLEDVDQAVHRKEHKGLRTRTNVRVMKRQGPGNSQWTISICVLK
ncbi:hypothetical protein V8G54_008393 [Vigna mungo]|uniref:Uncharacterized protein n=1 Tax=Vigna mungo TaxID=3915 RepID=A0AAQ3P343_VIGMU